MKQFSVSVKALNLRSSPNLIGKIIAILSKDTVVKWLGTSGDGYWQQVEDVKGKRGWAASKYLTELPVHPLNNIASPWMPIAQLELGMREILGNGNNPRVIEYLHSTTLAAPYNAQDETAWCSAFINWCIEKAGYAGTDSAWARSWLNWGREITIPELGCVTIFRREGGGGHVGFFVSRTIDAINVLGGNQSDSVCEQNYSADRLLGYRMPE